MSGSVGMVGLSVEASAQLIAATDLSSQQATLLVASLGAIDHYLDPSQSELKDLVGGFINAARAGAGTETLEGWRRALVDYMVRQNPNSSWVSATTQASIGLGSRFKTKQKALAYARHALGIGGAIQPAANRNGLRVVEGDGMTPKPAQLEKTPFFFFEEELQGLREALKPMGLKLHYEVERLADMNILLAERSIPLVDLSKHVVDIQSTFLLVLYVNGVPATYLFPIDNESSKSGGASFRVMGQWVDMVEVTHTKDRSPMKPVYTNLAWQIYSEKLPRYVTESGSLQIIARHKQFVAQRLREIRRILAPGFNAYVVPDVGTLRIDIVPKPPRNGGRVLFFVIPYNLSEIDIFQDESSQDRRVARLPLTEEQGNFSFYRDDVWDGLNLLKAYDPNGKGGRIFRAPLRPL